jgi:hypothetical protein
MFVVLKHCCSISSHSGSNLYQQTSHHFKTALELQNKSMQQITTSCRKFPCYNKYSKKVPCATCEDNFYRCSQKHLQHWNNFTTCAQNNCINLLVCSNKAHTSSQHLKNTHAEKQLRTLIWRNGDVGWATNYKVRGIQGEGRWTWRTRRYKLTSLTHTGRWTSLVRFTNWIELKEKDHKG